MTPRIQGKKRSKSSLIHEKLKKAKPFDQVNFYVKLPAYLLSEVKTYGDTVKVLKNALEIAHDKKFVTDLMSDIVLIRERIESLELEKEVSPDELDRNHLKLLELYRDIYFRLKAAPILKRKRK